MVDSLTTGVKYTWFIEDEVDVGGNNNWNWSLLEDVHKLWAATVDYIAAGDRKVWHFGGNIVARFCLLFIRIKVLECNPWFDDILIGISHHASSTAYITVLIAAVD